MTMESKIKILAIDDDKIIHSVIRKSLNEDNLEISFAKDGEEGLEKANTDTPDIIILDIEMPGKNGFEVCEALRSSDQTKDIPVIFLSSDSTLRSRMQGYEVGADDYLVKPFEKENLYAKIQVLTRYREDKKLLLEQFEVAQKTAYMAMTGSSELGIAMNFIEKSYSFYNFKDLSEALLHLLQQYNLNCVLMLLHKGESSWFSVDEAISPLEKEMLEMLDRSQRFTDFGHRTIINYQNLSLLVRNMPLDDMERYGRIKDLLPVILAAVDSKINSIMTEQALAEQSEELLGSFGLIRARLYHLAKTLISKQNNSNELLQKMVTELNSDLLGMGLEDDQEHYILHRIDTAIEDAKDQIDASHVLYNSFSDILVRLQSITSKHQELVDAFAEMNTPKEDAETIDDSDSIEFF